MVFEKEDLKFGPIKLTNMAPLAIAYEKGYFEDEGLYVTHEAQANWKALLDRVGALDGAHMLAGGSLRAQATTGPGLGWSKARWSSSTGSPCTWPWA